MSLNALLLGTIWAQSPETGAGFRIGGCGGPLWIVGATSARLRATCKRLAVGCSKVPPRRDAAIGDGQRNHHEPLPIVETPEVTCGVQ